MPTGNLGVVTELPMPAAAKQIKMQTARPIQRVFGFMVCPTYDGSVLCCCQPAIKLIGESLPVFGGEVPGGSSSQSVGACRIWPSVVRTVRSLGPGATILVWSGILDPSWLHFFFLDDGRGDQRGRSMPGAPVFELLA